MISFACTRFLVGSLLYSYLVGRAAGARGTLSLLHVDIPTIRNAFRIVLTSQIKSPHVAPHLDVVRFCAQPVRLELNLSDLWTHVDDRASVGDRHVGQNVVGLSTIPDCVADPDRQGLSQRRSRGFPAFNSQGSMC